MARRPGGDWRLPISGLTTTVFLMLSLVTRSAVFSQTQPELAELLHDVRQLEQTTHAGRHQALLSLLQEREISFQIETFQADRDSETPPRVGRNVIVELGRGVRQILVGAHYDAHQLAPDQISRAAVDNGASVVILSRLIENLAGQMETIDHRIKVIFFDLEEEGLLGSIAYLRRHSQDPIDCYINLDVAAFGDTLVFGPSRHPENRFLCRLLQEICLKQELPFLEFPHYPPSDDRSFRVAGIPSLSMAILPRPDAHRLWLFTNTDSRSVFRQGFLPDILRLIHTPLDSAEQVDSKAMTLVQQVVLELILQLDSRSIRSNAP